MDARANSVRGSVCTTGIGTIVTEARKPTWTARGFTELVVSTKIHNIAHARCADAGSLIPFRNLEKRMFHRVNVRGSLRYDPNLISMNTSFFAAGSDIRRNP